MSFHLINVALAWCPSDPSSSACMTTSTLATNIDSLGSILQGYFQVMITNFWPILLGITILLAVVGIVFYAINKLFRHRA